MAKQISKNARKGSSTHQLVSRWGGSISMHTIMENGKIHHYAQCEKTGNKARRPKDLM